MKEKKTDLVEIIKAGMKEYGYNNRTLCIELQLSEPNFGRFINKKITKRTGKPKSLDHITIEKIFDLLEIENLTLKTIKKNIEFNVKFQQQQQ